MFHIHYQEQIAETEEITTNVLIDMEDAANHIHSPEIIAKMITNTGVWMNWTGPGRQCRVVCVLDDERVPYYANQHRIQIESVTPKNYDHG